MQRINKYDGGSCTNLTYRREVKSYYRQGGSQCPMLKMVYTEFILYMSEMNDMFMEWP